MKKHASDGSWLTEGDINRLEKIIRENHRDLILEIIKINERSGQRIVYPKDDRQSVK